MTAPEESRLYDAVVIGSGFGGSMLARQLVAAGLDVLMLERGDWVERGVHNWAPGASVELTPHYSLETPYRVQGGRSEEVVGLYSCVGGPSVFYGGVSLRLRERDFESDPSILDGSGARWPLSYSDLEPWYRRAEAILDVVGEAGADPTEPPRSAPYPHPAPELSGTSRMIAGAARRLGLTPFHLPLAIRFGTGNGCGNGAGDAGAGGDTGLGSAAVGAETAGPARGAETASPAPGAGRATRATARPDGRANGVPATCIRCTTCDTFACAIGAKNDLATAVLPDLLERGLELRPNTVAVRLEREGRRLVAVRCVDRLTGRRLRFRARRFVLSAGALGSPHLLLASGLEEANPAGDAVGRYLMRHRNAIVFGIFPDVTDPVGEFHKQIGIHDFYFGDQDAAAPAGKLGAIQQVQTPPVELIRENLPGPLGYFLHPRTDYLTGLLVMAEDQPRPSNRIAVDPRRRDRFGLPSAVIAHRYTRRDRAAADALTRRAKEVLREAGAMLFYVHRIETFSHAVGTVRMGDDPGSAPLDVDCRFRGIENLRVVDGSVMPTSGGLNPSLTISAIALRVGAEMAAES